MQLANVERRLKMYKLKVVDEILQRLLEPRKRIQVVAGPRQVGKTTSLEQAVADFRGGYTYKLAEGLGFSPLEWLISEWNAARAKAKAAGGHLLIVDEIQKIKGWSEVVKRLWDEDSFHHVDLKVCLLGSSRLLLQKGLEESLAGRFEMIDIWHWSFADMQAAFVSWRGGLAQGWNTLEAVHSRRYHRAEHHAGHFAVGVGCQAGAAAPDIRSWLQLFWQDTFLSEDGWAIAGSWEHDNDCPLPPAAWRGRALDGA